MPVSGTWNITVKTPMGDQSGTFTVYTSGATFAGTLTGGLGSMDTSNGTVSGNTLRWQMALKMPMPMTLDCEATVDGDTMTGKVSAGVFGTMTLTGTRAG